jgi:hypothetical protein
MEFYDLYNDGSESKGTRPIKIANGTIYKYDFRVKRTVKFDEKEIICKDSIVEIMIRDENILKTMKDTINYVDIIKNAICKNCLKLDKWNFDFIVPRRLINYLTKKSLNGELLKVDNPKLLHAIDLASAGGCMIAKRGNYEGKYYLYDITNSYNKFFLDFNVPSNPQFKTVKSIEKLDEFDFILYRLKVNDKNFTQQMKWQFKTNRIWFSYFDILIYDMFKIDYELVNEKNNCVEFMETLDTNFEWMRDLNNAKQLINGETESLKKKVFKNLLSSFWGNICKYNCITQEEYGKEIPDNYYHKVGSKSGEDLYIHPEKFYLYGIAICKPFVLAYARYRLLKQVYEIEKKGFKVIYAHTDSIITDASPENFDIGSDIGQWKLEKESNKNVIIENIAKKNI